MNADNESARPQCPTCGAPLVAISGEVVSLSDTDMHRRHRFSCPAGCHGPGSDGTFEVFACPACGASDTAVTPRDDGVEEVECLACGTIASMNVEALGGDLRR